MCQFGLTFPGCGRNEYCRKRTGLLTSFKPLEALSRRCPGTSPRHEHVHARGDLVVDGVRLKKAKLAGHYPAAFTSAYAALVAPLA